jgi:hypothetical protein
MWNWFNCYLSGRHEYGLWCEPGAIFLRCVHCGRRSPGWSIDAPHAHDHPSPPVEPPRVKSSPVVPFPRVSAS